MVTKMNGTEKQAVWAEDIKSAMLLKIDEYLSEYKEVTDEVAIMMGVAAKEKDASYAAYTKLKDVVVELDDAEWFIKYRNTPICVLAEQFGA